MFTSAMDAPSEADAVFLNSRALGDALGTVLGRELFYLETPEAVVQQRFLEIGFPAEFADAYMALLAETIDRPALVAHDVEKILDRPARTFVQWVSEHHDVITDQ